MRNPWVWLVLMPALFGVARWGGRLLATHHNDAQEVGATLAVALSAVVPFALVSHDRLGGGAFGFALTAAAVTLGLFAGYGRTS